MFQDKDLDVQWSEYLKFLRSDASANVLQLNESCESNLRSLGVVAQECQVEKGERCPNGYYADEYKLKNGVAVLCIPAELNCSSWQPRLSVPPSSGQKRGLPSAPANTVIGECKCADGSVVPLLTRNAARDILEVRSGCEKGVRGWVMIQNFA